MSVHPFSFGEGFCKSSDSWVSIRQWARRESKFWLPNRTLRISTFVVPPLKGLEHADPGSRSGHNEFPIP